MGSGTAGYRQLSPRPRWAEQDPIEIYDAGCQAIRQALADAQVVDPSSVLAVGVSTILAHSDRIRSERLSIDKLLVLGRQPLICRSG